MWGPLMVGTKRLVLGPETLLSGGTYSVSSYSGGYTAAMAFNGTCGGAGDYWQTPVSTVVGWILAQYGAAKRVTRYGIKIGANLSAAFSPRNWTLSGWNGTSWIVLDTRTGVLFPADCTEVSFTVSTPAYYTQYKMDVTLNNGGSALGISELALYERTLT